MKRIFLIFALVCVQAGMLTATDFYVSSHRPGRSDNNAGTSPTAPWASFGKVMQEWGGAIQPGDTIHIERGSVLDYSLSSDWVLPIGGNASAGPITLRGDTYGTGDKPVLRRSGGAIQAACFWIRVNGYVTLRDFVLDGGSGQGRNSTGVLIGGSGQAMDVSNVNILNLTLTNLASSSSYYISGIYLAPWNGFAVSDCLIEGNSVSGYNAHGLNHYPEKTRTPNNSRIIRATYRNNHVFGARDNYGNIGSGIHISYGGRDNLFEYNLVEGPHYGGSIMTMNCSGNESGLIVRYNVVTGNTLHGGILLAYDGNGAPATLGLNLYGNIVAGSHHPGIWVWTMGHVTGLINIYNNTLYDNNRIGTTTWQTGAQLQVDSSSSAVDVNVRNNIMVSRAANTAGLFIRSGYTGTLLNNNNLYWHTGGTGNTAVNNRGTIFSVDNVRNFEASAQNTNPRFTDPSALPTSLNADTGASPEGLMPLPDSPAVNNGAGLGTTFATALNPVARPQGAGWDIGAYELPTDAPVQPPAAPTALNAAAASVSSINLTWTANADNETAYQVERSNDGVNFVQIATLPAGSTTFTDLGLNADFTYYYRVRAMLNGTPSDYSNIAQATTQTVPDTTPPQIASAAAAGDPSRVILTFTKPLEPDTAGDPANYNIVGPIGVRDVVHNQEVVTISVGPAFSHHTPYVIEVSSVRDLAGNAIEPDAAANFVFLAVDPDLLNWYNFEGDTMDRSGHNNHAAAAGVSIAEDGRIGRALRISNQTDYLETPFQDMNPAAGSIALWVQPLSFRAGPQYIFGHSQPDAWNDRIQLYTEINEGQLNLGLGDEHFRSLNLTTLNLQQWTHLALIWQQGTYRVYVDGSLSAQGTYSGLNMIHSHADIGNDGRPTMRDDAFDGLIDDVRYYNRAISAAEVALLADPVPVPEPPTVGIMP